MMILFWILIVMVLYEVLGNHKRTNDGYRQENTAEEQLKLRYANGEIDEETFKNMKKNIK